MIDLCLLYYRLTYNRHALTPCTFPVSLCSYFNKFFSLSTALRAGAFIFSTMSYCLKTFLRDSAASTRSRLAFLYFLALGESGLPTLASFGAILRRFDPLNKSLRAFERLRRGAFLGFALGSRPLCLCSGAMRTIFMTVLRSKRHNFQRPAPGTFPEPSVADPKRADSEYHPFHPCRFRIKPC